MRMTGTSGGSDRRAGGEAVSQYRCWTTRVGSGVGGGTSGVGVTGTGVLVGTAVGRGVAVGGTAVGVADGGMGVAGTKVAVGNGVGTSSTVGVETSGATPV